MADSGVEKEICAAMDTVGAAVAEMVRHKQANPDMDMKRVLRGVYDIIADHDRDLGYDALVETFGPAD